MEKKETALKIQENKRNKETLWIINNNFEAFLMAPFFFYIFCSSCCCYFNVISVYKESFL